MFQLKHLIESVLYTFITQGRAHEKLWKSPFQNAGWYALGMANPKLSLESDLIAKQDGR